MPTRNRIPRENSELPLDARRRTRDALFLVAGPLKCKPMPRDAWDALGEKDKELQSLWLDKAVLMCRAALAAGKQQGPDVFSEVKRRVDLFWFELIHATIDGFDAREAKSLAVEIREMHQELADVVRASADMSYENSPANLMRLRTECVELQSEIGDVVQSADRKLALLP